jgi:hypothetical protein
MQWKVFWSVVAPVFVAVWVAVWLVTGAQSWLVMLVTALLAAAIAWAARYLVRISPMFARLTPESKGRVVGWLLTAVAVYGAWSAAAVLMPHLWPVWALVLVGLGGGTYSLARVHEYLLRYAPPQSRRQVEPVAALTSAAQSHLAQVQADLAGPRDGEPHLAWLLRLAIRRTGLDWLRISNPQLVGPSGQPFGVTVEAWSPMELRKVVKGKVQSTEVPVLGDADARRIALSLRDITGRDFSPKWVEITEQPDRVGIYKIQANNEDVMRHIRPYRERPEDVYTHTPDGLYVPKWRSVRDPSHQLWGMDGMPIGVDVARHAWIVGGTTGGKSSYIHREWADVTLCEDALIWVCGVRKLYDLVGPWLEPYKGTGVRPPLDWVRADAEGVLAMLIAAMDVARWRQDQPYYARDGFKTILLYIDEASFALNTKARAWYDGQEVSAGDMYAECTQATASAGIHLVAATQRGVHHQFGDKGGDASSNIGREITFPSGDEQEIGRVTGNFKSKPLRHRGECYARLGDMPPVRAKGEYLQTPDPSKPLLHDGPKVDEVAWNRRYHQKELDAGSTEAAGTEYTTRHQYVTEEYLAALRGVRRRPASTRTTIPVTGLAADTGDPERDKEASMRSAIDSVFARIDGDQGSAVVTPLSAYRTRADRVEAVIRDTWTTTQAAATPTQILAALHDGGDTTASSQLVANALRQLVEQRRAVRPRNPDGREVAGHYLPPDAVPADTPVTVSNS